MSQSKRPDAQAGGALFIRINHVQSAAAHQHVGGAAGSPDFVVVGAAIDESADVRAVADGAAVELVIARAAENRVVPHSAENRVVAVVAEEAAFATGDRAGDRRRSGQ